MVRVLAFGSFDPLHAGHRDFFRQAKAQGGALWVVVARDSYIRAVKRREPHILEEQRLGQVAEEADVDKAVLGQEWPAADPYALLAEIDFEVLALGYDQRPDDNSVRQELERLGKGRVAVVRLRPYRPDRYKSSIVTGDGAVDATMDE